MAAEAEEQEPKAKLPIVKILIMVVGALVLVGVGAGAAILFTKLTKPADENPLAIVIERKGAPAEEPGHAGQPAAEPAKATTQQDKMKTCNASAKDKKGDDRKAFMKECLSAK